MEDTRYVVDTDGTFLKCNPITPDDAVNQLAFEDENIKFAQQQLDLRKAKQEERRLALMAISTQLPILADRLNKLSTPIPVDPGPVGVTM